MAVEIERRFLLASDAWRGLAAGENYCQGYLSTEPERTVRVRVAGNKAWLTVKGIAHGAARAEFEYAIDPADARTMLSEMCPQRVEKTRYRIEYAGFIWEVDEFSGENSGLIVAEIELPAIDTVFERPDWIGREITGDHRYSNAMLSQIPYSRWGQDPA
ncbi:CYTH domain-containing protein [Paludibacterium yongneupense]|uniref:CYTH domain-containing protein n=1 Tax=Paludibacterium yongneupense TaxID=400061 RepID=UPI0003F5391F|nr:CYTH domain-containing protein [Paludibacterium yongneupense]